MHRLAHLQTGPEVLDILVKQLLDHHASVGVPPERNVHALVGDSLDEPTHLLPGRQLRHPVHRCVHRVRLLEPRGPERDLRLATATPRVEHDAVVLRARVWQHGVRQRIGALSTVQPRPAGRAEQHRGADEVRVAPLQDTRTVAPAGRDALGRLLRPEDHQALLPVLVDHGELLKQLAHLQLRAERRDVRAALPSKHRERDERARAGWLQRKHRDAFTDRGDPGTDLLALLHSVYVEQSERRGGRLPHTRDDLPGLALHAGKAHPDHLAQRVQLRGLVGGHGGLGGLSV